MSDADEMMHDPTEGFITPDAAIARIREVAGKTLAKGYSISDVQYNAIAKPMIARAGYTLTIRRDKKDVGEDGKVVSHTWPVPPSEQQIKDGVARCVDYFNDFDFGAMFSEADIENQRVTRERQKQEMADWVKAEEKAGRPVDKSGINRPAHPVIPPNQGG